MLSGTGWMSCPEKREMHVRMSAPLMTVVGAVAGLAAAAVAYQSATGAAAASPGSATSSSTPTTSSTWLPCEKGWKLEGQTCVRLRERVVVVHDLPSASEPQQSSVSGSSDSGRSSGSSDVSGPSPSASPTPAEVHHETETQSEVEQPEVGEPTAVSVGGGD